MPNIFNLFKPKNEVKAPKIFFGNTAKSSSGVDVTERTALNVSAVYACVRVVAEAIASLPLRIYKDDGNGLERCTEQE